MAEHRSAHNDLLAVSASYSTELPFRISAFLSGGYGLGWEEGSDSYHADLTLQRALGSNLNLGVSGGYYARNGEEDDLSVMMRMQYRPDRDTSLASSFDTRSGRATVAVNQRSGQGLGSWQTSIDATREAPGPGAAGRDDDFAVNGSVDYAGNRGNVSLFQESRFAGIEARDIDQRTSLRAETAIAFADGHVAVGRPVSDGFAIVSPYAGLADNEIRIGKGPAGAVAHTDLLGPALVPSVAPYTLNRVQFEVDDLPPGYDLGDGLFDLQPKNKSGYALKVGSNYTVTALGTLLGPDGKPVALLTGAAREDANPDKTVELFTNRTGRFTAQGLAPGRWTLELATQPPTRFALTVPQDTVGLYRAGTLRPVE